MKRSKRVFDLAAAICLFALLSPVLLIVAILIIVKDGQPVFYVSERMKTPTTSFKLIKFRTMRAVALDSGVSGGDKSERITRTGKLLRRTRIDEFPQLWNVIKGDMSFVGPRPPLREYVETHPETYAQVLKSCPGITGLASIYFSAHEERLLAQCSTSEQTDEVYRRICVPRKARLDMIYQKRQTMCFDIALMFQTVFGRPR